MENTKKSPIHTDEDVMLGMRILSCLVMLVLGGVLLAAAGTIAIIWHLT